MGTRGTTLLADDPLSLPLWVFPYGWYPMCVGVWCGGAFGCIRMGCAYSGYRGGLNYLELKDFCFAGPTSDPFTYRA